MPYNIPMSTSAGSQPADPRQSDIDTLRSRRTEAEEGVAFKLARGYFRHHRQLAVIGSLAFATLVCIGLFAMRATYTRNLHFINLPWNLFLAWLPAASALVAYNLAKRGSWLGWLVVPGAALFWLLFLPNAPYLVTDLIHLQARPPVPLWYDLLMLVAFAWTGLFLGLVSLFLMQEIVRKAAGRFTSWVFVLGAVGLSSFGIYLGRFLRWNSWDVFFNPLQLLSDVLLQVRHPLANLKTYAFSAIFAFFLLSVYLMFLAMTHFRHEAPEFDRQATEHPRRGRYQ
jgi:uncharacterized membrane protein